MKYVLYSHFAGEKQMSIAIQKEIKDSINSITVKPAKGAGKKLRMAFLSNLKTAGWSSEVAVSKGSKITITSMKNDVGLCMQTGNMGRMYADLMKLQTMYLDNSIKVAAIVVPSAPFAKILGSNIAQADRLEKELEIFKKAYHVPTIIFALE